MSQADENRLCDAERLVAEVRQLRREASEYQIVISQQRQEIDLLQHQLRSREAGVASQNGPADGAQ